MYRLNFIPGLPYSSSTVLQYETLASEPARAIAAIDEFPGEPDHPHDFTARRT